MSTMSDKEAKGPARPPSATRFKKGQSGNPAGRPRKVGSASPASAFDIVIDRTLTITQGGTPREVTIDEALHHKTYQDALKGNRAACREVMAMIVKREKVLAARTPHVKPRSAGLRFENDPTNAVQALLLLGIAVPDPRFAHDEAEHGRRLRLEPWSVQAALGRRGRAPLSEAEVRDVERCTRDAGSLVWPKGRKR